MLTVEYQLALASAKSRVNFIDVLLSLLVIVCTYFVLIDCLIDLFRTCENLIVTFEILAMSSRNDRFRN